MQEDFISQIEHALEYAIETKNWSDAVAFQEMCDWFVYDKTPYWM